MRCEHEPARRYNAMSLTRFPISGFTTAPLVPAEINQTHITLIRQRGKKKRKKERETNGGILGETTSRLASASYAVSRLSANLARDLHGSSTFSVPSSDPFCSRLSFPVWSFFFFSFGLRHGRCSRWRN